MEKTAGNECVRTHAASKATAWCDGAALPNPGATGIGYLIRRAGHPDVRHGEFGGYGTNNEAELHALEAVTKRLRELGVTQALIHSDSRVAIGWFTPPAGFRVEWTPRADNAEADRLATAAAGNRLERFAGHRRTWRATLGETRVRNSPGPAGTSCWVDLLDITDAETGETCCRLAPLRAGEWCSDKETGDTIVFKATVRAFAPHGGRRPRRVLWHTLAYPQRLPAAAGGSNREEACDPGRSHW